MTRYKDVTFVGGYGRSTTGGDQLGINAVAHMNTDYWTSETHTDGGIKLICQQSFTARLMFVQMTRGGSSVQARRAVYQWFTGDITEDFLETSTGAQQFTVVTRKFNVGDIIRCWEEIVANASDTIGMLIIMAVK